MPQPPAPRAYYRGYNILPCTDGDVHIYFQGELIDTVKTRADAEKTIDEWKVGR